MSWPNSVRKDFVDRIVEELEKQAKAIRDKQQ
jgi:hypothetical protein